MIISLGKVDSPDAAISNRISEWADSEEPNHCIALNYALNTSWSTARIDTQLAAIYLLDRSPDRSIRILVAVTDEVDAFNQSIAVHGTDFDDVCRSMALTVLNLTAPLFLETVVVPKPWGREVWYTGSEVRGVSTIQGIPLPWVISLFRSHLTGQTDSDPVLLKILDPLPQEVYGDLYFEMHTHKTEVYVVTHVDQTAWPTGTGQIRLGFSEEKLAQFPDHDRFRSAYLASVQNYQKSRRQIDARFDAYRSSEGFSEHEPVPASVLEAWQERLPPDWREQEQKLRTEMNEFTGTRDLSVGDVVCIDPFTPHALQHGVRAIEFQTPYYERKILSFAQKVLTQNNWDTESAIQEMTIRAAPQLKFEQLHPSPGVLTAKIADFQQFSVLRISVEPNRSYQQQLDSYALVICISGSCDAEGLVLGPEDACLVPRGLGTVTINNTTSQPMQCLIACPA